MMNRRFLFFYFVASSFLFTVIVRLFAHRLPALMEPLLRPSAVCATVFLPMAIAIQVVVSNRRPHLLAASGTFLCATGAMLISFALGEQIAFGEPSIYAPAIGMLAVINGLIFFFSVPAPSTKEGLS